MSAPHPPPLAELTQFDPDEERLFPRFSPDELALLAGYGEAVELAPGDALFEQGRAPYHFWVVLDGEVRVTKKVLGEEMLLTIHRPREFAGELAILSGRLPIATARALGTVRALRIDAAHFSELVATSSPVAEIVLPAMTGRAQEVGALLQKQEKLAALGRMAAGLAHELNNPAAAVRRAAAQLDEALCDTERAAIRLHAEPLSPEQQALLDALHASARAQCTADLPLTPLERSRREDEMADWLEDHGVEDGWRPAPMLVAGDVLPERLEEVAAMDPGRIGPMVAWLAASLTAARLVHDLEQGAGRISLLVSAIKQYSHVDQSPALKETDLHAGLESTLTMLSFKTGERGARIERDFDPAMPPLWANAGELNQVWTHLLDNALDAIAPGGIVAIRTIRRGDEAVVEIRDDGSGIPPAIAERIWEPFFTTKDVGEGSGLGLDIVRRIVVRQHRGDIGVESRPGETCFHVHLPLRAPDPAPAVEEEGLDAAPPPGS